MRDFRPVAIAVACCVSGCVTVGPDYVAPKPTLPEKFLNAPSIAVPSAMTAAAGPSFWSRFGDPDLDALVARAVESNNDIAVAAARVREARAVVGEVRGGLLPQVDGEASAFHERASVEQLPGLTNSQRTVNSLTAGLDSGWEIDLFGGIRRSVEAAGAQAQASEADLDAVRLSVSCEVARTYFQLRGLQERLRVARASLDNQSDTLRLTTARLKAGRGTDFDVARSQGLVETTRSDIPAIEQQIAATAYALAVLTAQQPASTRALLEEVKGMPRAPSLGAMPDPAALLRDRPDIRSAERSLAAATASIGVSTAELFPSVTLVGAVGVNAGKGRGLGRSDSLTYSLGPSLHWNLLDFGRTRARIAQADARADAALASYQQSVLRALADTEDALMALDRTRLQAEALLAAAVAARNAARLANRRYEAGATDLLDVLDAQRQLLAAEDRLSASETAEVSTAVSLFKAFGGHWTSDDADPARPQALAILPSTLRD